MRFFDSHNYERVLQHILNKLFKGFKRRNNRFVMYYGTDDYMTQLAYNNTDLKFYFNLIFFLTLKIRVITMKI